MLSAADNELLTRTGPDAPMGELFRRFWLPALLSQELPEPDCPPVRVKIMGEDLVAFRDTEGRVGLVDPRCPHRGANLYFGRNEQCGLRCVYHGWKFDVTGRCVDLPTLPPGSTFRDRVRITAYPVREWGEFVWVYLGPAGPLPALSDLEFALVPPAHRFVSKKLQQCNWAQAAEGGIDTAHFSFLHMPVTASDGESDAIMRRSSADRDRTRWMRDDPMPEFHVVPHDAGLVIGASRRADGTGLGIRSVPCPRPSASVFAPGRACTRTSTSGGCPGAIATTTISSTAWTRSSGPSPGSAASPSRTPASRTARAGSPIAPASTWGRPTPRSSSSAA